MNIRNNLREFKEFGGFVLDDFQAEALAYFFAAFLSNLPGGLGVLPTGAGKTVIAACFIDLALKSKSKVIVLVPKIDLVAQWRAAIYRANPSIRVTTVGGRVDDWTGDVVIACVAKLTLPRLAKIDRREFPVMIVDEAHHAMAESWQRVIEYFLAEFRLGLSATPIRGDGRYAAELFYDRVLYIISLRHLIALNRLVDAVGYRVSTDIDLSSVSIGRDGAITSSSWRAQLTLAAAI